MYKKLLFIGIIILCFTGCTRIDNNDDYSNLVVDCLSNKKISNGVSLGYKFYIPKGVKLVNNYDYNQKFLVDDKFLYLYVDIVSYYYNSKINYDDDDNSFYYRKINYDGKKGFIRINKESDIYFVKILYNYSVIEFYCDYDELYKMVSLSGIILNNIDYNKKVIKKIMDESLGAFSEVTYEIKRPDDSSGSSFSQYLEEYVQDDDDDSLELPDDSFKKEVLD